MAAEAGLVGGRLTLATNAKAMPIARLSTANIPNGLLLIGGTLLPCLDVAGISGHLFSAFSV